MSSKHCTFRNSYGIVPWLFIDGEWHCILQISFSSQLLDVKLDPMRGTPKNKQETPVDTAIRETLEESAHVFDFRKAKPNFQRLFKGLYHVKIVFDNDQDIETVLSGFDNNQSILEEKKRSEVNGLVLLRYKETKHPIRLADQIVEMMKTVPPFDEMRLVKMFKKTSDNGLIAFEGRTAYGFSKQETTTSKQDNTTETSWKGSSFMHKVLESDDFLLSFRKEQIVEKLIQYPQDLERVKTELAKPINKALRFEEIEQEVEARRTKQTQ
ncbi:hypothetical protein C9374_010401 [Naegleria lovaniensis]|uniref:Nudix hydrolase domain-containing protein n=1 Tax=Naegleria lovaniensis TaxID=51637 RepID=A0AA88KFV8_NAELO|nr:uncharacterized protein C9374_010401 [Naegleria lovaniensis]KAG2374824.1 hypothetical protein C9374_010401 [Naegleria lovaniensis]